MSGEGYEVPAFVNAKDEEEREAAAALLAESETTGNLNTDETMAMNPIKPPKPERKTKPL